MNNLHNGTLISGDIVIDITVDDPLMAYLDMTVKVDGQDAGVAGQLQNDGTRSFTDVHLSTDDYSNGGHSIQIADELGNTKTFYVAFNNSVSDVNVSSIFDVDSTVGSDVPAACTISGTLDSAQDWTVEIQNVDGITVRTFTGNSSPISVTWDGNDDQGNEVEDSCYTVSMYANAYGPPINKKIINKNRIGECFILLDEGVFPGGKASMLDYLKFIKQKMNPLVGISFNRISSIVTSSQQILHDGINAPNHIGPLVNRINAHFATRLQLFYVDSHGGNVDLSKTNTTNPFFGIGPCTWYSKTPSNRGSVQFDLSSLVQPVGYGSADPPALVWIDSCNSAGGDPSGDQTSWPNVIDDSFAYTFGSGSNGYGVFMGWNGYSREYGAFTAPNDCWTFWRSQFWTEIGTQQNFQTALSKTDSKTSGHGFGSWPSGIRPNDRKRWAGAGITSL